MPKGQRNKTSNLYGVHAKILEHKILYKDSTREMISLIIEFGVQLKTVITLLSGDIYLNKIDVSYGGGLSNNGGGRGGGGERERERYD